jgi:hypothetical protein
VHPAIAGASFLFPRHSRTIHRFDGDLLETLDWVLSNGICLAPSRARYVEPLAEVPGYEARWREGEGARLPFEAAIKRLAALDARAQVVRDLVDDQHRADFRRALDWMGIEVVR